MEISEKYKRLALYVELACKSLGWNVEVKQEEDDLIFFVIDDIRYFVSRSGRTGQNSYLGVMVPFHGSQDEPPGEDERLIETTNQTPEALLPGFLLDTHWKLRKQWAMESCYQPEDCGDTEEQLPDH